MNPLFDVLVVLDVIALIALLVVIFGPWPRS